MFVGESTYMVGSVAHVYSHCSRAFPLFDSCELTIAPSPRELISHRNPSPCQLCQFRSSRNPAIFLAGWRLPDPSYAVERDRQIATNCATPYRRRSNQPVGQPEFLKRNEFARLNKLSTSECCKSCFKTVELTLFPCLCISSMMRRHLFSFRW